MMAGQRRTYRYTGARFTVHRDLSPDALLGMVYDKTPPPWEVWDAEIRMPVGAVPHRVLAILLARELNRVADRRAVEDDITAWLERLARRTVGTIERMPEQATRCLELLDEAERRLDRSARTLGRPRLSAWRARAAQLVAGVKSNRTVQDPAA